MAQPLALFSVSNKAEVAEHARALLALPQKWEIVATSGTYAHLRAKLPEYAGRIWTTEKLFGVTSIMGGLLKTLDQRIHAALLATPDQLQRSRDNPEEHPTFRNVTRLIELVCVDLYPFQKAAKDPALTSSQVRAQMDLGGRAILNSAVKGQRIIVSNPSAFPRVLQWLTEGQPNPETTRDDLAAALCVPSQSIPLQSQTGSRPTHITSSR